MSYAYMCTMCSNDNLVLKKNKLPRTNKGHLANHNLSPPLCEQNGEENCYFLRQCRPFQRKYLQHCWFCRC